MNVISYSMEEDINNSYKIINKEIKKQSKSLRNRLQSIKFDHKFFVDKVVPIFPDFPIIPNERCGIWYCKSGEYEQSSYFKSTDGHINQWDFNTRRLNFHLLPTIERSGGIIIVDSTRRGKKIPDSLSKTIPIWCAVLNSLMIEDIDPYREEQVLYCPPDIVTQSEYDRILSRIPEFVKKLRDIGIITGKQLQQKFQGKFLRPIWVYPGSSLLSSSLDLFTDQLAGSSKWETPNGIIPIILCTVSYQCQDGVDQKHGFTYVQGAADDHELWADKLSSSTFWDNFDFLGDPNKSEDELLRFIEQKVTITQNSLIKNDDIYPFSTIDKITSHLHLGCLINNNIFTNNTAESLLKKYSLSIICNDPFDSIIDKKYDGYIRFYPLKSESKKSSRDLRISLIDISKRINERINEKLPILICCNTGKDISIGIVLVALCQNYDLSWNLNPNNDISKNIIRKHLTRLISCLEGRNINPSRMTLNSVNAFLM